MTDAPPKLFISYSWTDPQHEQFVVRLAERLVSFDVDAILDKWDLKEGQDAIAFMEEMVINPTINKVLMIVDKVYAEKANSREGGVGTEAQIISKEIYENKGQEKFVALVLEKDENGKPYLPLYCQSRIYIDFSESHGEKEFDRLLRWIFDKPLHVKPARGKPPVFLSDETKIDIRTTTPFRRAIEAIEESKGNASGRVTDYLQTLSVGLESFRINVAELEKPFDEAVIESIENFMPYRGEFIELLLTIVKYGEGNSYAETLHKFFEGLIPYLYHPQNIGYSSGTNFDNFKFIIHELFLYTIAILLKEGKIDAVCHLVSNNYYLGANAGQGGNGMESYREFCHDVESINKIGNAHENIERNSSRATILNERAQYSGINFRYLMQADFILFIRDELISIDSSDWGWWPITLLYAARSSGGEFEIFARAESIKYFDKIKPLLGIDNKDDITRLLSAYNSNKKLIPRVGIFPIKIKSLINFDNLATKP